MVCSNCGHEEIDHEGIGTTDMKCYGSGDWACSCKKFEEEKKWVATRFYGFKKNLQVLVINVSGRKFITPQ